MKAGLCGPAGGNGMRRAVYAGVDWFRLPAALLVIAIHTAPLSGISKGLDAAVTYGLGRIAVPFFLMTTGYFLLAPCFGEKSGSRERWRRFERKILLIYAASTLLYLPVAWYAGNLPGNLTEAVRMLLFDGTFYHLWYFPALLIGGRIALGLGRAGYRKALTAAGILYLIGLFGDSYYGLTEEIPLLKKLYGYLFQISSYTRNGIFYTPLFLIMGAFLRNTAKKIRQMDLRVLIPGMVLLAAEAYLVFRLDLAKHDSMYFSLPFVMYVLYQALLSVKGTAPGWLRNGTLCVYVIHPLMIVLVRGAAKWTGTSALLVECAPVHWLAVSMASFAAAAVYGVLCERSRWLWKRPAVHGKK